MRASSQTTILLAMCCLAFASQAQASSRARFMGQELDTANALNLQKGPANEPNATALSGNTGRRLRGDVYSGEGTAYSEAVANSGAKFACSYRYLNDWASTNFAAINKPMWDGGNACGRCLTAWCVDERCETRNKRVQVMITDLCPECAEGDVDFSIPVYREITGMWPHRLAIEWEWSDCSDKLDGDIVLTPKDGFNPHWQAFFFANTKYQLKAVTLNGKPLERNEFQFWVHHAPLPDGPVTFELEAVNGKKIKERISGSLEKEHKLPNFD